jgi:uncharacterized protein YfaS (alpha-2-macroglobulin family)
MRIKFLLLTITTLSLIFFACNRNIVNLEYTNAKDEVSALGNLTFRFDKPLVSDSLLNRWDSTEYISFEPRISGRFRWETPDELIFSPSRPLSPATSYKADLKTDILQYSRYGKIGQSENISFHTPELKLENSNATWVAQDEKGSNSVPQVDLYFNYPVNPANLKEKLHLEIENHPVEYALQTLSAENRISIRLLNLKMEDKDYDTRIILDKGLVPEGGTLATSDKTEIRATILSPFILAINDVVAEQDGAGGSVKVLTSQQVSAEDISSYIKLDPKVRFSVEAQDDGFLIHSDYFDNRKSYALTIIKGLRGQLGGVLKQDYTNNVAFGQLEPSISFASTKGIYLASKGEKNIEVRITNVPKLKLVVSKIYENNLLAAQKGRYYPQEFQSNNNSGGEDEMGYDDISSTVGDVIYEKEIDTRSLPQYGNSRLLNVDITDKIPDFKGIYHIMLRSVTDYWVRDSRLVSLSDIGLIAKEGKERILVFANSIKKGTGLEGVNILAYGANNQLLGMGPTNAEGVATINYTRNEFSGFRPAMVIAKTADDFNYLPFSSGRVNTSRFEVGGKHSNSTGLDAYIYAERDIYRPGEKVNFSAIVRDKSWKSPGEIPMKLKFLLPNGRELKTFRKNLNEQGSLEGSIDLSPSAITGSYSLELYTSTDVLLATQAFRIEEFVPDRIKVTAKLDKEFLRPGEDSRLSIHAVNFFGPAAAGRNYECEIQVKQKAFSSRKYKSYDFSLANQNSFFDKIVREGKTNDQGDASEKYDVPAMYKNLGLLQTSFYATVFDETGRPVSRTTSVPIYTQSMFLGLGDDGYFYYPLNQKVNFPLIALDKDERLAAGATAKIEVVKHEYRTVLSKSGSYFRYESQKEDKLLNSSIIPVNGENTLYSFVPRSSGEYELRVSLPGANSYVSKEFYSYGSWGAESSSFEVNNEGHIEIEADKASYNTGESVKALFKAPFNGRMLVTIETDKVISYQYVNVDNRAASVDLKLSEEEVPNAYISATLIKPHEVSDIPLTVAHGFKSIQVEERNRKMKVAIVAQKSVRSRTHQKVTVRALPNSMVTLAAVDNGVLQVSDFETPDAYNHFYAKRALEVNDFDLYPLLFPERKAKLSSTGGDSESDMAKRTNPMPAKRIKILSYWSGIRQVSRSGEVEFEFDVPSFSGEVRLMAIAYKNESFGSAEEKMTVADPIVLSTALPRFLSPKDTVAVAVTVTNTSSRQATGRAELKVSGPLRLAGPDQQSLSLNPNSETRAVFQVFAEPTIGEGKVTVQVSSLGEKFSDETEISIRPSSPLQKITGSGSVSALSTQTISLSTNDFIPSSVDLELVVSRSPAIELGKYLKYLVEYPYGCTEQTVSIAFPQLYFGDMADLMHLSSANRQSANFNILEAIRKIKMRQLYNGAITLWDNEDTENWWATIYSAHFLLEARKAGFDVDKRLMETVLDYINNQLKDKKTVNYYYNRDQSRRIAPKEVIYGLYVLSLAGRPNLGVMNYYKSNPAILSLDCKYLLSAAYALAGDKNSFRQFLPDRFEGEESVAQSGGSFYSDIRDESLALNVLEEVDPGNGQIPLMAKHVTDKLKQRTWFTTQEIAFSFLSLGKIARQAATSGSTAEVRLNGKTVGSMNGNDLRLTTKQLSGNQIELAAGGGGRVYYFWQSQGISASGTYREEDSYLKVRRHFYDRYGRTITGNMFRQNDLIIVELTLEKSYNTDIDNVVITDMLPAGFELENPRTKDIPGMDWIKDAATPTALDVRDDRINLFVNSTGLRQSYYYAVRAVSPGVYHMGPVSADAMYNGEYHSYNGGGVVRVIP